MNMSNDLKLTKPVFEMDNVRESFLENLYDIVEKYFFDKSLFSSDDFTFYVLDEHILETNCNNNIFTCIYVEINQPNNYKPNLKKTIISKKNLNKKDNTKYRIPELYISLSDIKKGLYETFVQHFDNNNIIWIDKFGICTKSIITANDGSNYEYYFKVIPTLTYYNSNNTKGIVYYSGNDIQIEYPELFYKNFIDKNKKTKDLYRQIILIFKNILLKDKSCQSVPSEIIETMVYNVPNNMLKKTDRDSLINIINFIRNNPIRDFKTIDEQDYAFSSLYRSMSAIYSRHILKIIEKSLTRM